MKTRNEQLSYNNTQLQVKVSDISVNYSQLQTRYEMLQNKYDQLSNNNSQLQDEVKQLKDRTEEKWCPDGGTRLGCSCYFKSKEKNTWYGSRADCQKRGADLVVINNKEEQVLGSRTASAGR
ncbi:CD209 antigen-like [Perca flavescens]|uniref:CD209 antigen-like n=1 Tax=Perca flavescens TaxID=8167 RepID=UPI00106EC1B3|nr:CD209 antigen-like [Perca flavescens]